MNIYLRLVAQPMQIRFEFRKRKPGSESGSVYVILTLHKSPYGPYATGIKTTRPYWDARRSIRQHETVKDLNRQLNEYESRLEKAHAHISRQQSETGSPVIIDGPAIMDAMEVLQAGPLPTVTLALVYEQFIRSKQASVQATRTKRQPGQIAPSTLATYPKRWVLISQYLQSVKKPRVPVTEINYAVATELNEWLTRQTQPTTPPVPYSPATVNKVLSLLKMLLTYAQSRRYIPANPLATFSCRGSSPANPRPLTPEQIRQLETCDLPPVLRYQCDSWLVAAELCLHYADYARLPGMKIITAPSGQQYIQHDRAKQSGSKLTQTVNLTPRAIRLLEKYNGASGLYYASSQYFSKILKKIARQAGLVGEDGQVLNLQFGMGRDTGLTERAKQGANSIQLSSMAGWSKPQYASRYIGDQVGVVEGFVKGIREEEPGPAPQPEPLATTD